MITLLTGQPGNGKTSKIINVIREAHLQGRIVYTVGIPKLLLPTIQISRAKLKTWHERTEISVDEKRAYVVTGKFDPLADFNRYSTEPANDGEPTYLLDNFVEGSLIIVDEAQKGFEPTSPNNVPEYVSYLSEHRHHGLDFLFISQDPAFVHDKVHKQATRHWHIRSQWMGRKIYEWSEAQMQPKSQMAVMNAVAKRYKVDPTTFDLYESASIHTVVKHKIPKMAYFAIFLMIALPIGVYAGMQRFQERYHPDGVATSAELQNVSNLGAKPLDPQNKSLTSSAAQPISAQNQQKTPVYENIQIASTKYDWSKIGACMTFKGECRCYGDAGDRLVVPPDVCTAAVGSGWSGRPRQEYTVKPAAKPQKQETDQT